MKLIAHRGYWEKKYQQNTFESILLGLIYADGVEIDLRMNEGEIIISHDHVKNNDTKIYFKDVLELSKQLPLKVWALNIKEDGLSYKLRKILNGYPELRYFCFDMSLPETYLYIKLKLKISARVSDIEKEFFFISKRSEFYVQDNFKKLEKIKTKYKKKVMLISPELHHRTFNKKVLVNFIKNNDMIYLCTDRISDLC